MRASLYSAISLMVVSMLLANQVQAAGGVEPKQPYNQAEWRYSVRPGDNLIHFARQHLINPR